jgi:predicted dehydrogenase
MLAFQQLIASGRIDLNYLTTHTFDLETAPVAYDMMMEQSEKFIGILIKYDTKKEIKNEQIQINPYSFVSKSSDVNIGFIGAGSYAQSHLLPNIEKKNTHLLGVMTATATSSRSVAERYGFQFCTGNAEDILQSKDINTVFITTRHESHADYVLKALQTGKHVFVEKPLCLALSELEKIKNVYSSYISADAQNPQLSNTPHLMVGYNRRFSPLAKEIKKQFGSGAMSMMYRVNAGNIPADSWIQDMEIGGGRILGEVCHFVDFLTFINGSLPITVYATVMSVANSLNDILNVSLTYENGSIGTIGYFANGDKSLPKERVEIFANGSTAVLNDFKSLSIYSRGKVNKNKLMGQDKGQKEEVRRFIDAITEGSSAPIPFSEIYSTSLVTFAILESIRSGNSIRVV